MKSRSLTAAFTDLIDDYKVSKVDDLIKDIKKYIKTDNKDHEIKLANSLDALNISNTVDKLSLIFTDVDFDKSIQEWKEYQNTKDYKVQTLKTKITTFIKKAKGKSKITDEQISTIKSTLNHHKVSFNLECIDKFMNEDKQKEEWQKKLQEINSQFGYANWLNWASSQAYNISFATHIAKLTHSSIKDATNIFFDEIDDDYSCFSTASLKNKMIEVSQSNNALAPIGKMLQLESSDSCLSNKLRQGDLSDLAKFSKNSEQLENWKQGFLKVFELKNPVTHYLSKQIYFPVNTEEEYHIISPMQSSTLDQAIFEKINFVKFSPEMTAIRKSKREETYNPNLQIFYPNIAILKVTQSNPGNATPLNGKRGGKRYLLSSSPPVWESSFSPPIKQENLFDGEFNNKAWRKAKELQTYLLKLNFALEKQGREFGNKQIRDKVKELINELIEILFDYAAQVQNLDAQTGWSKESKLKEEHQLWLDPYRNDLKFQEKRKSGYWQEEVCKDFALWINKKLEHKKMKLAKFESDKWAKLLKNRLKRFEKGLEVTK